MVQKKSSKNGQKSNSIASKDAILGCHGASVHDIKEFLVSCGIEGFKRQAGYMPGQTDSEIIIVDIAWIEYGLPGNLKGRWTWLEIEPGHKFFVEQILETHTTYFEIEESPY